MMFGKHPKFFYIASALTLVATMVLILYILYLLVWPFEVVRLHSFRVTHTQVPRNGAIPYELRFDKRLDYKPEIRYYITADDAPTVELVTASVNRATGAQTRQLALPVPPSVTEGCGKRLQIDLSYQIIFNRHITYSWRSNDFCITAPSEQGGL